MTKVIHLFITDPFVGLLPRHDSSMALMAAALKKGHPVFQAEMAAIEWRTNHVEVMASPIVSEDEHLLREQKRQRLSLNSGNRLLVWIRPDPPVDERYIRSCQLLRLAKVPIINNPNTLMTCDEKLFALEFPQFIPATVVLQEMTAIQAFITAQKCVIAKPVGKMGGQGVLRLDSTDMNLPALMEMLTNGGRQKIILQQYLPQSRQGDKRIFLLDGEPIGAILRKPRSHDHRANMAVGGVVEPTEITDNEREICGAIAPRCRQLGLYLVGLDIIGERLTEINITSPTGLQEIQAMEQSDPAGRIIAWSESFAASRLPS